MTTWLVLLVVSLVLRWWGKRYQRRHGIKSGEVSRNPVNTSRQTGPKWEQIVPITEAELDQEDDL